MTSGRASQATSDHRDDRHASRERWRDAGWYRGQTFPQVMAEGAERFPDTPALFHRGRERAEASARELSQRAVHMAGQLQRLGVEPGDVIAIQVPNWLESAVAYQAALCTGAVVVPIIHIYGPREVGFILRQSEARVLIIPDRWRGFDYLARLRELDAGPTLEHVIVVSDEVPAGATAWHTLEQAPDAGFRDPGAAPEDRCLLVYTSGTTAEPKGVQHTHETLLAELDTIQRLHGSGPGTVRLGAFPAGHIAGVLSMSRLFAHGTKWVLMDAWDPELAAELIAEQRVTDMTGAPYYLDTLLSVAERGGPSLESLQTFQVGAAAVPAELVGRADRAGIAAYRSYGSTEHPTISTVPPHDALAKRAMTDGPPCPGSEARVVDADGGDVPVGAEGEIVSRGPELFVGYQDTALDAESFLPGGWYRTGDLGRFDAEGYLTVTDRLKDVVIRGGETISSVEIEDILRTHPAVADVAVVAAPHERLGECACAFVVLRPEAKPLTSAEALAHFKAQGAAKQKTPERIETIDELPRTAAGKVQKFKLREQVR